MGNGRQKFYVLNKETDYSRGRLYHMKSQGGRIGVEEGGFGAFLSRQFDGRENGAIWHRLCLETPADESVSWCFTFYASDRPDVGPAAGREETENREEEIARFAPFIQMQAANGADILLHDVRGRYFWFLLEVSCPPGTAAWFGNMKLFFPKDTWMRYLPELYDRSGEGDFFLERFLSVFQSLYDDLNRKIDRIPDALDTGIHEEAMLLQTASWLGISGGEVWNVSQLRELVREGGRLYGRRGTREGICGFIRLYTGARPLLAEPHKLNAPGLDPKACEPQKKLYGRDPYVFTVLTGAWRLRGLSELKKIIEEVKPAWMEYRLVALQPYILLDGYSYLGVNSILGECAQGALDDSSVLDFTSFQ